MRLIYVFLMSLFLVACGGTIQVSTDTEPSVPTSFGNKLIVVSTGKGLNRYGRDIQETLGNVLEPYLNKTLPFKVLLLEPGRVTNPFSSWGSIRGEKTLRGKIRAEIRFGYSPDALKSLKYIEATSGRFNQVLYLTDNGNIPSDPSEIRSRDVPKFLRNIQLTVLTTGSCRVWTSKVDAKCQQLYSKADIENGLRKFLN